VNKFLFPSNMEKHIHFTLCSEGPSDRVLLHHISWALKKLTSLSFSGDWADPSVFQDSRKDISTRVVQAISYYPCNLLFVHRDADGSGYKDRKDEVFNCLRNVGIRIPTVSIVPVRMTEAWLLCDEAAIRSAAGRPRGDSEIPIPHKKSVENLSEPKKILEDCLCVASEHKGRKLDIFRRELPSLKYRVAELVEDFSVLVEIPSFREFMSDLESVLESAGMKGL
jgi:hypothetical protein